MEPTREVPGEVGWQKGDLRVCIQGGVLRVQRARSTRGVADGTRNPKKGVREVQGQSTMFSPSCWHSGLQLEVAEERAAGEGADWGMRLGIWPRCCPE